LGQKYDFFDIRGFKEICEEVLYFYKLFNSEENFSFFIGTNPHGYYTDAQKEMVSFFCKIAKREIMNLEPEIEIEKSENLFATKKRNVIPEGSKPHYIILKENSEEIIKNRKKLSEEELKENIRKCLKILENIDVPHYRVLLFSL
jgi:hypothetical protein